VSTFKQKETRCLVILCHVEQQKDLCSSWDTVSYEHCLEEEGKLQDLLQVIVIVSV